MVADGGKHSYYDLLDVKQEATDDQIKQAYRRALLVNHPDKSKGAAQHHLSELREAFQILISAEDRSEYDRILQTSRNKTAKRPLLSISLDDFTEDQDTWSYKCRCGNKFTVTYAELEQDVHILECNGCSESIYIEYHLATDDQE
jgi:diphthamide biosynthesis protein 4